MCSPLRCLLPFVCIAMLLPAAGRAADAPVYELRVYTCEPGKLDALNARFREHTCRLFEKHGIRNVAYWTPVEGEDAGVKLYYVLEHKSREAARTGWEAFRADPEWKAVAAKSQQEHGKILARPPESTYMAPTDYSPAVGPVDPAGTYELRIYTTNAGRLEALHARFRDHTCRLFEKHGIHNVAYWSPLDEPASTNTLIYIIQHDSRDGARDSWKEFGADPDWQKARAASEEAGKILAQRPQSTFLKPVDYSPRPKQP